MTWNSQEITDFKIAIQLNHTQPLSEQSFENTIAKKAFHRKCARSPCFASDSLIPMLPAITTHVSREPLKPMKNHVNPSHSTYLEYEMTKARTKYKIITEIPFYIEINKYLSGMYA